MAEVETAGSVAGIWLFPVKSMQGTRIEKGEFTERGLVGDRAYALIDNESGKVVSAKSVRLYPNLFNCKADFVESPQSDRELPPVRITLPDGSTVTSDSNNANQVLSSFFGRDVTLARAAPKDFTIDMYHPDIEDADPGGRQDTEVEQKLGSALFAELGVSSPVSAESFFDLFPVSILTTGTLKALRRLQPGSDFDERRFRMDIIIDTAATGFVENEWIDRDVAMGDELRAHVPSPDARCVMPTLAQDDLPQDRDILRTLVKSNRLPVAGAGEFPCAGVYAIVTAPGRLSTGDDVSLVDS